jgi:hypothetical protein
VAPPAGRAVQPHQARGLCGDAVGSYQLLLLAHRADEPERVRAEADQAKHREQRQAQPGRARYAQALARAGRGEYQKRQRQPGGDLDPDPRDQRDRAGTKTRADPGGEQQRCGERQQQQRVVVIAADRQLEQHRVQAHEGSGEARRGASGNQTKTPSSRFRDSWNGGQRVFGSILNRGRAAHQRDRGEAGGDRERLQGPQPAGQPERGDCVATESEQRAVRRVLEGPAHEQVDGIGGCLRGDMRVGVQPV